MNCSGGKEKLFVVLLKSLFIPKAGLNTISIYSLPHYLVSLSKLPQTEVHFIVKDTAWLAGR